MRHEWHEDGIHAVKTEAFSGLVADDVFHLWRHPSGQLRGGGSGFNGQILSAHTMTSAAVTTGMPVLRRAFLSCGNRYARGQITHASRQKHLGKMAADARRLGHRA